MRAGIRTRLLGSFGIILVFVALIGTLGLYQLGQATRALHDVADDEVVGLTAAYEIRAASLSMQRDLRTLVLAFTPDEKQKVKESMDATESIFVAQLATLDATLQDEGEREVLTKLQAAQSGWSIIRATITQSALDGDQLTSRMALNGDENRQVINALNAQVDALIRLKHDRMAAVVTSRDDTFELARAMMLGAIALSLLIGLGVAVAMARSITSSVKAVQATLTAMADECVTSIERGLAAMAAGDLTVEARAQTPRIEKYGSDEVGQTARVTNAVLDKMEATIVSYEEARTKLATLVAARCTEPTSVASFVRASS